MTQESHTQDTTVAENVSSKPVSASRISIWQAILLAGLVGVIVACAMLWWRINQTENLAMTYTQSFSGQLETLQQNVQASVTRITESEQRIQATRRAMTETLKQINQTDRDWQLSQLIHIVKLLQEDLRYGQHDARLLSGLESLYAAVTQLGLPILANVQTQLQTLITALKQLQSVDKTAILANLHSVSTQLDSLPIRTGLSDKNFNVSKEKVLTPDAQSTWQEGIQASLKQLKDLVVIRQHDTAVTPLIAPEAKQYLNLQAALMLAQARWALTMQDQAVYTESLETLSAWITVYFDTKQTQTQTALATLKTLQDYQVDMLGNQREALATQLQQLAQTLFDIKQQLNATEMVPATPLEENEPA